MKMTKNTAILNAKIFFKKKKVTTKQNQKLPKFAVNG